MKIYHVRFFLEIDAQSPRNVVCRKPPEARNTL